MVTFAQSQIKCPCRGFNGSEPSKLHYANGKTKDLTAEQISSIPGTTCGAAGLASFVSCIQVLRAGNRRDCDLTAAKSEPTGSQSPYHLDCSASLLRTDRGHFQPMNVMFRDG